MQTATATWRNGQVELLEGVDWAEGTQLRVSPLASNDSADHDWHAQNARRLELIAKKVHTKLSDAERGCRIADALIAMGCGILSAVGFRTGSNNESTR